MRPKLTVIELVVQDMRRSLDFYRELGLEIPEAANDQPHVEYELGGGLKLAWDTEETVRSFHGADWQAPGKGEGRISLAFQAEGPGGVDAAYRLLVGRGYESELAPFDAPWGQRYAVVRDPDGNGVDLFAALPGSR